METRACARRETSIRIAIEMALFPSAEGSHAQVDLHRHRCPQLWTSAWHHSPHDAQFGLNLKEIMIFKGFFHRLHTVLAPLLAALN